MKQITLDVGSVFGRLTVIGNCMSGRFSAAICRCECGTVKTVRRHSLTKEHKPTRSCGCLALEAARVALRCDRGSSFESPEAAAAHRKQWLKEYAKQYDARPEQRVKRNLQNANRLAAMTQDEKERQRELHRASSAKPERKAKAKLANAAYTKKPGVAEKIKLRTREWLANKYQNDPLWLANYRQYHATRYALPEVRARQKETTRILFLDPLVREKNAKASEAARKVAKQTLSDTYVRSVITQGLSLRAKDVPSELIPVMREKLKISKFLRETK